MNTPIGPIGKLNCLLNCKIIETVHEVTNLFDIWADTTLHLLLLKSSLLVSLSELFSTKMKQRDLKGKLKTKIIFT